MMKSIALLLIVSATALGAVACGGTVEQPQSQASAAAKAPIGQNTHGVVKLMGEALGEVSLRPEQRVELEKLAAAAEARHSSMGEGKKELMLALADQVERGAIDRTSLQSKIDRTVADLEKARPEDRQALARVHAILDAEQRGAFVDALEAKFKHGGRGGHGHHGAKDGAGAGKKDGASKDGKPGEHARGMHGMHGMRQLAEDLKLTDEQKEKIRAALTSGHDGKHGPDMREMRARFGEGKQALESFRTEKFDATAAGPSPEKLKEMAAHGTERMVGMAEKILPILTPEQRKIAAEKIRERANGGLDMPFGR